MNKITTVHIGVDISKNNLDICFHETGKTLRIQNNSKAIAKFINSLKKTKTRKVVYEATGGYENLLTQILATKGFQAVIVNPRRIRSFAIAKNVRAKTDKIDAKMIATFAASECCDENFMSLSAQDIKFKELTKRKSELMKMRSMEKTRLKNPRYAHSLKSINKTVLFFNKQIAAIEGDIAKIIESSSELKEKQQIMETMIGIGRVTAQNLLGTLPELGKMDNKKIASLVGVAPIIKQSGKQKGFAKIEHGRTVPRQALFLAAMSAIRYNPVAKEFYTRLKNKGKKPMVAIVAVMRKLLVILNTMVRKKEVWMPQNAKMG